MAAFAEVETTQAWLVGSQGKAGAEDGASRGRRSRIGAWTTRGLRRPIMSTLAERQNPKAVTHTFKSHSVILFCARKSSVRCQSAKPTLRPSPGRRENSLACFLGCDPIEGAGVLDRHKHIPGLPSVRYRSQVGLPVRSFCSAAHFQKTGTWFPALRIGDGQGPYPLAERSAVISIRASPRLKCCRRLRKDYRGQAPVTGKFQRRNYLGARATASRCQSPHLSLFFLFTFSYHPYLFYPLHFPPPVLAPLPPSLISCTILHPTLPTVPPSLSLPRRHYLLRAPPFEGPGAQNPTAV